MDSPAPLVLFCYNRLWHLQQTIEHLQKNALAQETELFIFSDGAKTEREIEKVNEVRNFLKDIEGFKETHLNFREKNWGLAQNIISGAREVLEKYGKVIVMEDDLICTPDFLDFMNEALEKYKNQSTIFAITGWSPPLKFPESFKEDIFLLQRPASWSWATWKKSWEKSDWQVSDFQEFKNNKNLQKQFNQLGEDVTPMLKKQQKGVINSWAIRWTYTLFKESAYCVYPTFPKVHNIGADGSGQHVQSFSKYNYDIRLNEKKLKLPEKATPNPVIEKIFADYHKLSLFRKIINCLKGY